MIKKRIKVVSLACVLVCILPVVSYSLEKDDFLKFLINSSYPEAQQDKKTSDNSKNNNEKEYIKFHIGEENVPDIKKDEKKANNNEEVKTTSNLEYKNDIRVTKENPRMLIYHTHAGETYSNAPEGNYHSQDKENSVLKVGTLVTEELNKRGWGVVHSTTYNDYPNFNKSYVKSLETIQNILPQYKNIDIAIDLHRDGRKFTDDKTEEFRQDLFDKEHERMTTTINGEKVAKFFFVVGQRNPNVNEVRALAQDITKFAQSKYPDLILPVVEKEFGKFNQYAVKNHMLIEVGSNGTTIEESKASAKYVAEILDEYFKQR